VRHLISTALGELTEDRSGLIDIATLLCRSGWLRLLGKFTYGAATLATPAIAAGSVWYVYKQYSRAEKWKAQDLAAQLIARLENDEDLALACRGLDWEVGPLLVPSRYQPLFAVDTQTGSRQEVMVHNTQVLWDAMRPNLQRTALSDPRGLVYRACFDKLFAHFESMNRLLEDGQINLRDIREVDYWLKKIETYGYPPDYKNGAEMFQPFLGAYKYRGVVSLGKAVGVTGWSALSNLT
jgi:hypothetical protein